MPDALPVPQPTVKRTKHRSNARKNVHKIKRVQSVLPAQEDRPDGLAESMFRRMDQEPSWVGRKPCAYVPCWHTAPRSLPAFHPISATMSTANLRLCCKLLSSDEEPRMTWWDGDKQHTNKFWLLNNDKNLFNGLFSRTIETCTGRGSRESRGIRGNPVGMEANVAGFPREWKGMSRDYRGDGKTCMGFPRKCSCIWIFWCNTINVQISASAIHFHKMRGWRLIIYHIRL